MPGQRRLLTRVHSCYERQIADLPRQGRPVTIRLAVRRLRCDNRGCTQRVFAARVHEVSALFARQGLALRSTASGWRSAVKLWRAARRALWHANEP